MATPQQIASPGVYVTDDVGVEVTDGTASRVLLGQLPNGKWGLLVSGPNLSGQITSSPPGIQLGTPGAQFTDKGVEVSDGVRKRVTLGNIPGGDYGLQVLSADGTTVIIDGTSDMFRIQATGTLSQVTSPNDSLTASATLSGLGALSLPPAHQAYISDTNTAAGFRTGSYYVFETFTYVAPTSGASPTTLTSNSRLAARVTTSLDGSNFCVVSFRVVNASGGTAVTWYATYYVLAQTAL